MKKNMMTLITFTTEKKLEKIVEKMRARGSKITLAKLIKILNSKTEQEETYYFGW